MYSGQHAARLKAQAQSERQAVRQFINCVHPKYLALVDGSLISLIMEYRFKSLFLDNMMGLVHGTIAFQYQQRAQIKQQNLFGCPGTVALQEQDQFHIGNQYPFILCLKILYISYQHPQIARYDHLLKLVNKFYSSLPTINLMTGEKLIQINNAKQNNANQWTQNNSVLENDQFIILSVKNLASKKLQCFVIFNQKTSTIYNMKFSSINQNQNSEHKSKNSNQWVLWSENELIWESYCNDHKQKYQSRKNISRQRNIKRLKHTNKFYETEGDKINKITILFPNRVKYQQQNVNI